MCATDPLKSGDEGKDDDVSAQTRSKSKSKTPSKKRKSSTSEKKKSHSSSEPSPKKAKGAVTEEKVRFSFDEVLSHLFINTFNFKPIHFHRLVHHPKLTT